jgi:hypothetical protein
MRGYFNFRHVIMRAGIPSSNETNWAVGHMLASMAQKRGVEPARILAEKTDPNAKVAAPHCIAHYPMSLYDEALALVKNWWGEREAQGDLFDGPK